MVTPIYAAILAFMLIGLSINVIKYRKKLGAALGDEDSIEMKRRIRAQGNLAEYAPIFLIMLGYAEHGGLPLWAVNLLAIVFIIGRISHAYSLLKSEQYDNNKLTANPIWRISGMICTFNVIGLLGVIIILQKII